MNKLLVVLAALLAMPAAFAGELDPQLPAGLPQALIVRENAQGAREVFKSDAIVKNDADAVAAIAKDVNSASAVKNVSESASLGELDRVTSEESWCFWWQTSYSYYPTYSYHYYYSGFRYVNYYAPTYNYWYGGYRYSYYYPTYYYWY